MAQQQPTSTPIWQLAWVRQAAALAGRPKVGLATFEQGQQVYFWWRSAEKWMVFDGVATYVILATEDARQALKSCRDEQGQVRQAEEQDALTRRFYEAIAAQGKTFLCRPRF